MDLNLDLDSCAKMGLLYERQRRSADFQDVVPAHSKFSFADLVSRMG